MVDNVLADAAVHICIPLPWVSEIFKPKFCIL